MYVWHFLLRFLVSFKYINEPSNNDCETKSILNNMRTCALFHNYRSHFMATEVGTTNKCYFLFLNSTPTHLYIQDEWFCLEPILKSSLIKYLEACLLKTLEEGFLSVIFLIARAFVCNWNPDTEDEAFRKEEVCQAQWVPGSRVLTSMSVGLYK
jgi:hypothetical protein